MGEFGFEKSVRKLKKIKEKCYFTKPTSKRVMSIGNPLLGPMIG